MSARVTSTSEVRVDGLAGRGQSRAALHPDDVLPWLAALPKEAVLTPITTDVGGQRDPMHVLVGLRATWESTL